MKTKWYTFSQNNSGGSFVEDKERGIGGYVIIEAVDAAHANGRAENIGLYFDGCGIGMDCSCCGDRWCEASDPYDGNDSPMIYDEKVRPALEGEEPFKDWDIYSYMHPLVGDFSPVVKEKKDE